MKLGIDIDDVVTNTSKTMTEVILKESSEEQLPNLQAHMKEIMKGDISDPEVQAFCSDNYVKIFKRVSLKENAKEVMQRFLNEGHEIYFITARGENRGYFKGAEEVTLNYLAENGIIYNEIIFNAHNKAQVCLEKEIDIFVDDSVDYCEDATSVGVKSIVFTSSVNKSVDTDVERVEDWLELEKRIKEIQGA